MEGGRVGMQGLREVNGIRQDLASGISDVKGHAWRIWIFLSSQYYCWVDDLLVSGELEPKKQPENPCLCKCLHKYHRLVDCSRIRSIIHVS